MIEYDSENDKQNIVLVEDEEDECEDEQDFVAELDTNNTYFLLNIFFFIISKSKFIF